MRILILFLLVGGVCALGPNEYYCRCPRKDFRDLVVRQLQPKCGISIPYGSRMINGKKAYLGQFPWFVAIMLRLGPEGRQLVRVCGAVSIHSLWVLTAAHCLFFIHTHQLMDVNRLLLVYNYWSETDSNVLAVTPTKIIVHEQFVYPSTYLRHDLALLKLPKPLQNIDGFDSIKDYWSPICLPPLDLFEVKKYDGECRSAGIGWIGGGKYVGDGIEECGPDVFSESLQWVDLELDDFSKCKAMHNETVDFGRVCYKAPDGKQNFCRYDSGSGIECKNRQGYWTLEGIASQSDSLAGGRNLAVNVGQYRAWIDRKIKYN